MVTAVEVPVRVLYKDQAMKGLAKEDFEIYENGIRQEITVFEVISRKMSILRDISSEELKIVPKKRLFILIFNIFDYQRNVGEGIDYFFKNFFHSGDQLIILTEDKILDIEKGKSLSKLINDLKETLKKYKVISTAQILKAYRDLRFEADRLLSIFRGDEGTVQNYNQTILRFLDNYIRIWTSYRRQYLTPDVELYGSIIERVKQMEGEKWAICFQQREMFPKLKNEGPLASMLKVWIEGSESGGLHLISSRWQELQRSFDISRNFPTKNLKNLFLEANITFHFILLKSLRAIDSKDFEMREVAQDYEDCFRQISFSTGGHTSFSNKVVEALKEAAEVEDYYYLLVYNPKEDRSKERRNIEVKVNKRGADVISLKYVPQREAPPIAIVNFEAGKRAIRFDLVNYKMAKLREEITGVAEVRVTLFNEASEKVFDQGKTLNLFKKEAHVSLNFPQLRSGSYFIIIQAVDRVSNEIDVFSSAITI